MHTKIKDYLIPALICFICAGIMSLVMIFDYSVAHNAPYYLLNKVLTISGILLIGLWTIYKKSYHPDLSQLFALILFAYSWYGEVYLHWSYFYAFIEVFVIMSFISNGKLSYYFITSAIGLLIALNASSMANFPTENGLNNNAHYYITLIVFYIISIFSHLLIFRYRTKIEKLNEQFTVLGKKSAFLTHEMRTPLNRMLSRSHTVALHPEAQEIINDAQRIANILSSIEALSRPVEEIQKTFKVFNWSSLKNELTEDFSEYLTQMNIEFVINGLEGEFNGNKSLFYRLFKNLIINAVEAIGYKPYSSYIKICLKVTGDNVLIEVSNSNSTLPKHYHKKIFDPFYSLKKQKTNQGLGLYIVKNIVDAHNGRIEVKSEDSITHFTIRLPIS